MLRGQQRVSEVVVVKGGLEVWCACGSKHWQPTNDGQALRLSAQGRMQLKHRQHLNPDPEPTHKSKEPCSFKGGPCTPHNA